MGEHPNYFIHLFQTQKNNYIYDVNTNAIIKTDLNTYTQLQQNTGSNQSRPVIENLLSYGFLKPNPIQHIEHPATRNLQCFLNQKIQSITLQVTQQCNLRCKYCVYSGSYATRSHSHLQMSWETAKKGIDFLVDHSIAERKINISFYGGEPLLNFKLIQSVVEYGKKASEGKKISFNMTTNGTLFTDKNLTFLQDNNFSILISLDGPKEIHDQNRVFAIDGKGTYDKIAENIAYIKRKYPKLYENTAFNAVVDPVACISCANRFLISMPEIQDAPLSASVISSEYRNSSIEIPEKYFIEDEVEYFKVFLNCLGRIGNEHISPIAKGKFEETKKAMLVLRERAHDLPATSHPSGPCVPGAKKLFITVDGSFYPCESISEDSEIGRIGNVNDGFDIDKIHRLLNVGQITEEECRNCWGHRLCMQCFMNADKMNRLSRSKRLSNCKWILKSHENAMKDYCTLVEQGYHFDRHDIAFF